MFITAGTFLAGLVGFKPSAGIAKALGIGSAILLLLAVLGVAKCTYDRNLIENHDARQAAETTKADRQADTNAGEQRRVDDNRLNTEQSELGKAGQNAQDRKARRVARQRCIRMQQDARAAGRQPPACD
jgi:hypothetical protein